MIRAWEKTLLFVNKKKQKNFFYFGPGARENPGFQINKSFLRSFFTKKRPLTWRFSVLA
jgi:hypothetical protein